MVCLVVEIVYENILTFTVLNMLGYNVAIWIVLDVPYVCFCIAYLGSQVYVVDMRRLSIICHFMFYTTLVLLVKRKLPNVSETSSIVLELCAVSQSLLICTDSPVLRIH